MGSHRAPFRSFLSPAPLLGAALLFAMALLVGCSPRLQPPGPLLAVAEDAGPAGLAAGGPPTGEGLPGIRPGPARLTDDLFVMPDGTELPYRVWRPQAEPQAVVLALHGFNDYSRAFELPGTAWAEQGLVTFAYDQRGFGRSPHRGIWAGWQRLTADVWSAAAALRGAYPDLPLYLVGESMGGAVILAAFGAESAGFREAAGRPQVAGAILSAPAVWGRSTMPPVYRWGLWFAAHTLPWHPVSGSGLRRQASDNIAVLRELWRDPLTIRYTRTDAVWGLVNLMDAALGAAGRIDVPVLTLYGEKDEIVPPGPVARLRDILPPGSDHRLYPDGWHLLFRDLEARLVWDETASWMLEKSSRATAAGGQVRPEPPAAQAAETPADTG
ncbi:MAG: alpha/beta hydrolase [Sneathiellaceae bacterium]